MPQTPSRCGSQATLKAAVTSLRWRHPHRRSRHRTAGRLLAGGALGVGGCSPIGVDAARASRCHHPRDEVRRAQTAPARHSFCGDAPPSTDPIAPGTVRVQRARSGKEKRVGAKRRPARVEPVNPRCVGPVLRSGPRAHGGAGRIGMLTLLANRRRCPGNSPAARFGGNSANRHGAAPQLPEEEITPLRIARWTMAAEVETPSFSLICVW